MGKDRRKEKDATDEALGKEKDKFGKSTVAMPSENWNSRASSHFLPSKSCGSGNSKTTSHAVAVAAASPFELSPEQRAMARLLRAAPRT